MRYQVIALSISLFTVACSSDDQPVLPDSKVYMDAPIDTVPACGIAPLPSLALGTMAAPYQTCEAMGQPEMPCNWFGALTMGGMEKYFNIGGGLPMSLTMDTDSINDILIVRVFEATSGQAFKTGTAYNFETVPPTTIAGSAIAFIAEDVNASGQALRYYWASGGTITIQNIDKTTGSIINGTISATNMREINLMTGADVPGGCTTSLAGLSFYLKQETTAARVAPNATSLTAPDVRFTTETLPTN